MKRYIKYIITASFIVICICSFLFLYLNNPSITNIYTSEILIYKNGTEYEIKVDNKTNETYFREGDIEEVIYKYSRSPDCRLSIPNLEEIEGKDVLTSAEQILDFTYNIPFMEGCKYIRYLLNSGYNIEMYVCNSQYFECFLKNNEGYKRIVLFSESMMVCDMESSIELPEVADYLQRYNFNGYIDNKFSDVKSNDIKGGN